MNPRKNLPKEKKLNNNESYEKHLKSKPEKEVHSNNMEDNKRENKEVESKEVAIRNRKGESFTKSIDEFVKLIKEEITTKSISS